MICFATDHQFVITIKMQIYSLRLLEDTRTAVHHIQKQNVIILSAVKNEWQAPSLTRWQERQKGVKPCQAMITKFKLFYEHMA